MAGMRDIILQMINDYWKFDEHQHPISSWHDKQALLKAIYESVVPTNTPQDTQCKHEYKIDDKSDIPFEITCQKCDKELDSLNITPKQKAEDLIKKYSPFAHSNPSHDSELFYRRLRENSINCALISINEILELQSLDSGRAVFICEQDYFFWQQVKKELEDLKP